MTGRQKVNYDQIFICGSSIILKFPSFMKVISANISIFTEVSLGGTVASKSNFEI